MYTTMQAAMAGGEQVINLLDTVPDVQDQEQAVDNAPGDWSSEIGECLFPLSCRTARGFTMMLI